MRIPPTEYAQCVYVHAHTTSASAEWCVLLGQDRTLIFPLLQDRYICMACLFWGELHWIETTPQPDLILAVNYTWMSQGKELLTHLYKLRLSGDTRPLSEVLAESGLRVDPAKLPASRYQPISTEGDKELLERYKSYLKEGYQPWYPDGWVVSHRRSTHTK